MEICVSNTKRLDWIDACKGILICTIVLMHIDFSFWSQNLIGTYISDLTSLYKVSVFFCISGLTVSDDRLKNTKNYIWAKVKGLWIRVVIIGLLAVVFHNTLIHIGFYSLGMDYKGKIMNVYSIKDILKQSILTLAMANREVITGPMWYANVLFMALIILTLIDWFVRAIIKCDNARMIRFGIALCLMLTSSVLTNVFNFTIPRFNNTLTAVFLIDLCQLIYREFNCKFNNKIIFAFAFLVLLNLPLYGHLSMTNNYFKDPAFLVIVVVCSMYVLYFIAQHLTGWSKRIFVYIGKQSFWIMALQFAAFKAGSAFLNLFIKVDVDSLVPRVESTWLLIYYLLFGIFLPCIIGNCIDLLEQVKRYICPKTLNP